MKKQLTSFALFIVLCVFGTAYGQRFDRHQIFQDRVNTYTPSVKVPSEPILWMIGGESSWSTIYMYNNKSVLEISGKDSILTVLDARLAGKRLLEDQKREFDELSKLWQVIHSSNDLINFLLVKSRMDPKDVPRLDRMLAEYSKVLNAKEKLTTK